MRIFLCGAQGTGKSTLVMNVETELERKDSFSKEFLKQDETIQRSDSEKFNEFQDKILLRCLSEYVCSDNFIASRSIVDSYAYLTVNKAEHKVMLKNMLSHYKDYLMLKGDYYIYLPIEFDISKDGNENRNIDVQYQMDIDKSIYKYFNKLKAQKSPATFIELRGTVSERLEKLVQIIKKENYVRT
jgi:adenylate kinase family enzyme